MTKIRFKRKIGIPTTGNENGDKIVVQGTDGNIRNYEVLSDGQPHLVKGVNEDEQFRLNRLNDSQITKLEQSDPKSVIDGKFTTVNARIDNINLGVSGAVTTTQTLPQLNALPDGIYEAQTEGTYANGLIAKSGYFTKFKKLGTVWSLETEVKMPITDTSGLVAKTDIKVDQTSINKFNYQTVENGYVDPTTGADMPASDYKRSAPISLVGNTTGKLAISGLGTSHHGLGWKIMDIGGTILLRGASAIDVTTFVVDYTSVMASARSFKFTTKTNKSTDNINLQQIQVEFGDTVSPFQPYTTIITGIEDKSIRASDITGKEESLGKNKFIPTSITNGYIVVATGAYNNDPALKRTLKIDVSNNSSKLITVSGLGNVHWGLGWRINDINGNLLKFGQSAQDVTKFTIDYTSTTNPYSLEFTVLTNKTGDNTDLNNVQVEYGSVSTPYEPYTKYLYELLGSKILAQRALKADYPVADDDIVNLAYLKTALLTGNKLKDKFVVALSDSIGEDVNSFIRQAIPLMGASLVNLARSGARIGNHPTTQINLNPAVPINSPDNVLSNQVYRLAQATTPLGQEIKWTHPVTGEVFGVPTSIGVGTGLYSSPDLILIALGTNDTLYNDDFSTVKDLPLSSLPNTQLVGGLRWAVENLMILYPEAQIIFCTPIQSQPAGSRPFNVTKVKRDRIVDVSNYYAHDYIDMTYNSSVNEKFETPTGGRDTSDGLHPKEHGKNKMTNVLINGLNNKFIVKVV